MLTFADARSADPRASRANLDGVKSSPKAEEKNEVKSALGKASPRTPFSAFASLSRVGMVPFNSNKVNQDRVCHAVALGGREDAALFGVFDGHGLHGHHVSDFVSRELPKCLLQQRNWGTEPEAAMTAAYETCHERLLSSSIECQYSGTTAVTLFVLGNSLWSCNAGDSRAVLGVVDEAGQIRAHELSTDQKPDRAEERARILARGGRVHPCRGPDGAEIGPPRVWLAKQDVPGLAMTRSIGDAVAGSVGVIPTPEVRSRPISPKDRFAIVASDGVWEFIGNEEAVAIVHKCRTPDAACDALVAEASKRWREQEEVIDDISCVVIFFP
jgi:serine/threonine protein phosphatase PrpC